MGDKVQWSLNSGVLEVRQDGSNTVNYCVACEKAVVELLPHLQGKDHYNNLIWYILRIPSPSMLLLHALPGVVRAAKENNEFEMMERPFYKCLICPKRNSFSGIKQLEDHLNGKEHDKARRNMPTSPSLPQPLPHQVHQNNSTLIHSQQHLPSSSQIQHIQHTNPQYPPNPGPEFFLQGQYPPKYQPQYPPATIQSPPASEPQYPTPSHPQPTTSHLHPQIPHPSPYSPASHSQYIPGHQPQPTPPPTSGHQPYHQTIQPPNSSALQTQHSPALHNHYPPRTQLPASTEQLTPTTGGLQQTSSQQFRSDRGASALQEGLHPDVDRALKEGVVESTGTTFFKCLTCNTNATGIAPLLEHLRSDKHKKKAQLQTLPDISRMSIAGDGRPVLKAAVSVMIGVGRVDQVDRSWTFPWTIVSCMSLHLPSETIYRNLSMPRGLVLIFNYCFTGNSAHERHGAKRDSFNLKTLFTNMSYKVYLYEDFSKTKTEETLKNIQVDPFLGKYDSLIVFVLSHGKDDIYFYTGNCRDEDCMSLDEVRYCFTDTNCPNLKGKPKLFFTNFCRGKLKEPQTQYDSMALQNTAPRDMVTVYACINNYQAPRDPQRGTMFVQAWCEVLATYAHCKELYDLHNHVCDVMVERGGSTPEIQSYHFKKFYFNPVQQ